MRLVVFVLLNVFTAGLCLGQKTVSYEKEKYIVGVSSTTGNFSVLSKDFITLKVRFVLLTVLEERNISSVHRKFGSGYINNYCIPLIKSLMRENFGNYTMKEALFSSRKQLIEAIKSKFRETLDNDSIFLKDLLIETVDIPAEVKNAMEGVMIAKQQVEKQKALFEKSRIETEMKQMKLKQDMALNRMLDSSLTERVLQMKYIDVLSKLSESPNTKVVILGSPKLDVPVVLEK